MGNEPKQGEAGWLHEKLGRRDVYKLDHEHLLKTLESHAEKIRRETLGELYASLVGVKPNVRLRYQPGFERAMRETAALLASTTARQVA